MRAALDMLYRNFDRAKEEVFEIRERMKQPYPADMKNMKSSFYKVDEALLERAERELARADLELCGFVARLEFK